MAQRTSIVIAHHLATIRDANVIFVLQDAALVEQGSHDVLMAKAGAYAAMYEPPPDSTAHTGTEG